MEKRSLGKKLLWTSVSFVVVATFLILYFHVPLVPVIGGGILSFSVLLAGHFFPRD